MNPFRDYLSSEPQYNTPRDPVLTIVKALYWMQATEAHPCMSKTNPLTNPLEFGVWGVFRSSGVEGLDLRFLGYSHPELVTQLELDLVSVATPSLSHKP